MGHITSNIFLLAFFVALPIEAVTVSPSLCPTNKIAPHRRIANWNRPSSRTFGAFYELLTPNSPQSDNSPQDTLQEQPQEDQPDDCGEIEDYDENDLSSVSQQTRKRQDRAENRFAFGGLFHKPPHYPPPQDIHRPPTTTSRPLTRPPRPPIRPPRPQNPSYPPMRPPYWSGGVFSQNQYQPPLSGNPSDVYKPVYEPPHYDDVTQTYRPGVVGGTLNHVVGVTQARPTSTPFADQNNRFRFSNTANSYIIYTTPATTLSTRRARPRKLNNDTSVIGSFIDLFFK